LRQPRSMLQHSSRGEDDDPLPPGPSTIRHDTNQSNDTPGMTHKPSSSMKKATSEPHPASNAKQQCLKNPVEVPKDLIIDSQVTLSSLTSRLSVNKSAVEELSHKFEPLHIALADESAEGDGPSDRSSIDRHSTSRPSDTSVSSADFDASSDSEESRDASETNRYMSPGEIVSLRRDFMVHNLMARLGDLLRQSFREWVCRPDGGSTSQQSHEDAGNGGDPRQRKRNKSEAGTIIRFACPFFKHDMRCFKHPKWSCCWPGWPTVHRVK
jgi:hypothetical protein